MLRLLVAIGAALGASAAPRNDGKSDEPLSQEAEAYYDPAAQTFALYTLLGVATNASTADIKQAFATGKSDLEKKLRKKDKKWPKGQLYGLIYTSLDADEDGLLSEDEAASLVEALGLELHGEDDGYDIEAVATFRTRTCASKEATFSSKEHLMAVATYNSLRAARVLLGDDELRSKYDAEERIKAREYALDVDDDGTRMAYIKRKVFGFMGVALYGGIMAWTVVVILACLVYAVARALSTIPRAPAVCRRIATLCTTVLHYLNPGWSTVGTLAICAPGTAATAVLGACAVFLFLFSLVAQTPVWVQRGLCTLLIAIVLAWLVPALKGVLARPRQATRRLWAWVRGVAGGAGDLVKTIVPWVLWSGALSLVSSQLETHLLTIMAGSVALILAIRPLRSRAFRYLGQALADQGVTSQPRDAPKILEALQRLASLPLELFVPVALLDDLQVKAKLDAAGFSRRDDAATPSRAELEGAYDNAFGACTVCFAAFEAGDECVRLLCGHVVHRDCVVRWTNTRTESGRVPTCPQCTCEM